MKTMTLRNEYVDACILNFIVKTNGPQGGDGGHGGFTALEFSGPGFQVGVSVDEETVVLRVLGDAESRVLAQALRDAADFLAPIHAPIHLSE